jgi:S-methylmethionine transporter/histidine permease
MVSTDSNLDLVCNFSGIILLLNVLDVKIFSVSEFWLSLIKVAALGIFVILGITAITGILPVHASSALYFTI